MGTVRILHVVYECEPTRHRGGVQKVVYELASAQAALGHEVVIATLANDGAAHDTVQGRLSIRRFEFSKGLRRRYSRKLGSTLRRDGVRFDVVHTHNSFSPLNVTALRLARRWSAPLFVHSHGALDPGLLSGDFLKRLRKKVYIRLVETRVLNGASGVFALSEQEASWVARLGPKLKVVVMPNGIGPIGDVNDEVVDNFKARAGLYGGPVLLYVGRLVPKKNLSLIFEAVAQRRHEFPSLMLLICGERGDDPQYVAQLDTLAQALELGDCIRWAGFLDELEKPSAYRASDIFLHASLSEGMPMAVLEAMAAGLPCLVTPGTMMSDAAVAGAVLERAGVEGYAAALADLLRDTAQRELLGVRARQLAEQRYSWPRIAERICRAYQEP